jgi:6-pyruvoyltetrahydropterin/6-carboxytetrahydropterin synthase
MNTISREYHFAAAHRLEGHPKCGRLHGHNYKVVVFVTGSPDQRTGMVIDYELLDDIVKPIIDWYDHKYLVSVDNEAKNDPYAVIALAQGHAYLPAIAFSTAECISEQLATIIVVALQLRISGLTQLTVYVQESEKSYASYTIGD